MTRKRVKRRQNNIAAFMGRGWWGRRKKRRTETERRRVRDTDREKFTLEFNKNPEGSIFKNQRDMGRETEKPFPAEGLELHWVLGVVLGAPGPDMAAG